MKLKKGKGLICAALSSIVCLSALGGCNSNIGSTLSALSTDDLIVKVLPTTQKVRLDEDISSLNGGAIYIDGAKGEADSGQFIVRCDSSDIKNYDVTISDFTSGNNVIDSENVEICKQVYTYCSDTVRYGGVLEAGYYPDALIPMQYIKNKGENNVKKNENQGIWLNVEIPSDSAAGIYQAQITFTYNKTGVQTIPVSLTVYDFELAQTPYFKSSFAVRNVFDRPQDYWLAIGELDGTEEMEMRYYDTLLKYNADGGKLPADTPEMFVSYVRDYYPRIVSFKLPYRAISNTQNDEKYMEERMSALLEACIEDEINYFDKAYYRLDMFYDEYQDVAWRDPLVEPTIEGCEKIETKIIDYYANSDLVTDENRDFVQEVFNSVSNLRHHMTSWWDEKYGDYLNLCCPLYPEFWYSISLDEAKKLTEEKDVEWWSYGCVMSDTYPSPTWEIDDYAVSSRDLLWFNYENDIVGNIFWSVNAYCKYNKANPDFNVYTLLDDFYTIASREGLTNGDGYLLYPGAPYGSDYPFASVRLAIYRDGVDDHTYMSQLGETYAAMNAYGDNYNVTDAKGLVSFLNKQIIGRNSSKLDYTASLEGKKILASCIELAKKENFVIEKISVEGNEITYGFYAKADAEIKLNGQTLSGEASGQGKYYTGKIAIPQDRKLTLTVNGKSINLISVPQGELVDDFNDEFDAKSFYTPNKSSYALKDGVSLNTDSQYAIDGNSVKIHLNGRSSAEVDVNSYKPKFAFMLDKFGVDLTNCWSLEFYVYNPTDQDIKATIYLEGEDSDGVITDADYDVVLLKAGQWKKIVVDNFNVITTEAEVMKNYTKKLGVKIENPRNVDDSVYTVDLFVDNFTIRSK